MTAIRVLQVGLGPIGVAVARQLVERPGFELVGAVDVDPAKQGRDVGELLGFHPLGFTVSADLGAALAGLRPDAAAVSTRSRLEHVVPTLETCLAAGVAVVSSCEELAYPWRQRADLSRRIDAAARRGGRAVLATGVNPGFAMDALPLGLTAVCQRVDAITVRRVQDAGRRRLPFQLKIGAGLTPQEFADKEAAGVVRHVGLLESITMIADAMGWRLDEVSDDVEPLIADRAVASPDLTVAAGRVAGVRQVGTGREAGRTRVRLDFEARIGAPESYDEVRIEGLPSLRSRVEGGIPGDVATASIALNAIPRLLAAPPGLVTMKDLPPPHCWSG